MKEQTTSHRWRREYAPWIYMETENLNQAVDPALKTRLLRARNKLAPRGKEKNGMP